MSAMALPAVDRTIAFLRQGDDFLVTAHVNSDGDAIGACLGLQRLLGQLNRTATIVLPEPADARYDFLAGHDGIQAAVEAPPRQYRHVAVLDCPRRARIGRVVAYLAADARVLNVDHHAGNDAFGDVNLAVPEASSTCEILFGLARAMALEVDATTAAQLYTGIVFDTGGFRYSLATARTLEIGAELVRCGARLDAIADRVFAQRPASEARQLGQALRTLALHCGGQIACMHLDYAQLRAGDPEEVVNHGLAIRGVQAALLLKERSPGQFRVSLRSRGSLDVARIAARFGGGGHANAAGCTLEGAREEVERRLLEAIEQDL